MTEPNVIVTCPACNTANRYPIARPAEQANCGRCKSDLFPDLPPELTAANFDQYIGRNELPIVVDFWAPWCQPCLGMAPHFAKACQQLKGKVQLAKLDTQAQQAVAARFGIRSIPTLIKFAGGAEIDRHSGSIDAQTIIDWCA